jgi:hypothetical protein
MTVSLLTTERIDWLLRHPLDYASGDPRQLAPYRHLLPQPDGALLVAILAVDR